MILLFNKLLFMKVKKRRINIYLYKIILRRLFLSEMEEKVKYKNKIYKNKNIF
jgi:hypothetical protein